MTAVEVAVTIATSAATGGAVFLLTRMEFADRISQLTASRDRSRVTLAAVREELAVERDEHAAERLSHAETRAASERLVRHNRGLVASLHDLLRPARAETCDKIQLHTEDAARVFAAKVQAETGTGPMKPYRCGVCPRNPATGEKYLHITHDDRAERGQVHRAKPTPTSVRRRVTPEVIAQLKSRASGAA